MDSRVKLTNTPCVTRASYLISLRLEVLIYKSRMMVDNCNTNVCDACEMLNSVPKLNKWHFVLSVTLIITKFWDPGEGRSPCDLMLFSQLSVPFPDLCCYHQASQGTFWSPISPLSTSNPFPSTVSRVIIPKFTYDYVTSLPKTPHWLPIWIP